MFRSISESFLLSRVYTWFSYSFFVFFPNKRCPKSGGDKSRAPTLCLVCGTMLCSQSYCCQTELEGEDVGACTAHTYTCGSGVGIFLR